MGPHQVGAAHRDIGAVGHIDAAHGVAELRAALHQVGRDDAVGDDPAGAVDIGQEQVERIETLAQTPVRENPTVRRR